MVLPSRLSATETNHFLHHSNISKPYFHVSSMEQPSFKPQGLSPRSFTLTTHHAPQQPSQCFVPQCMHLFIHPQSQSTHHLKHIELQGHSSKGIINSLYTFALLQGGTRPQ
eukprot:c13578_g1_i1 orf=277-609(-)